MEQIKETFDFSEMEDWTLDIDAPEYLDDANLHRYLVLFYRDEGQTWCGSGVVVGHYLITVAHVMREKETKEPIPSLYYKYDGRFYRVDSTDIIYDGRKGLDDRASHIHTDLLVFRLSDISSPFVLNVADFETPIDVYARWYLGDNRGHCSTQYQIMSQKGIRYDEDYMVKKSPFFWDNCLLTNGDFGGGNSGTPIYRQNVVYGLLIGETRSLLYPGRHNLYNFIDARYIHEILNRIGD